MTKAGASHQSSLCHPVVFNTGIRIYLFYYMDPWGIHKCQQEIGTALFFFDIDDPVSIRISKGICFIK